MAPPPVEMWVKRRGEALLLDRGHGVAAADDDGRAGVGSDRPGTGRSAFVPWAKDGISKTPSGPFQKTVFASARAASMSSRVALPTSTMCHEAGIFSAGSVLYSVPRVTSLATTTSTGRITWTPLRLGRREDPPGLVDAGRARRGSCRRPCPGRAGTCSPSRRRGRGCRPWRARLSRTLSLPDTFAPPTIAANGRAGDLEEVRELRDLALHEEAGVRRQERGDPDGRGVGPVGRPERVVDVDVGVGRELLGELGVVLLLGRVEAEVLEEEELAGAEALDGVDGADPEGIAGDRHVATEELRSAARRPAGAGGRPGPCRRAGRGGWRG